MDAPSRPTLRAFSAPISRCRVRFLSPNGGPFFTDTFAGVREGSDFIGYWDESNKDQSSPSQPAAMACVMEDATTAATLSLFDGASAYDMSGKPAEAGYTENANGQYVVSDSTQKRGPYADPKAAHNTLYSRYHKSKFYCETCHDVSNTHPLQHRVQGPRSRRPKDRAPERSFAGEHRIRRRAHLVGILLSDYGLPGGAPGLGPFAPKSFPTPHPNNAVATCQDCHMPSVIGKVADSKKAPERPTESVEHPHSGDSLHDLRVGMR